MFTNIGQEFKRFLDRRIIGSINRAAEPVERAMCRATGTEPGQNCNISVQVGASWPVGEGAADHLSPEERAVRDQYLAATRTARKLPGALGDGNLGTSAAMSADLNALCTALCSAESQREFSAALLAELEKIALEPLNDASARRIASINRETASVLGPGLRAALMVGAIGVAVPLYDFTTKIARAARIGDAMQMVRNQGGQSPSFDLLVKRNEALAALQSIQLAQLSQATVAGTEVLGSVFVGNIRILASLPRNRVTALTAAISLGRTGKEINDFVEKYKDVESEQELYDALIREAIAPLGLSWP